MRIEWKIPLFSKALPEAPQPLIAMLPKVREWERRYLLFSWALLGAVAAGALFFFVMHSFELAVNHQAKECAVGKREFAYEEIGFGPLCLNGLKAPLAFPELPKELAVLGRNGRPDRSGEAGAYLLGLKSSGEERAVFGGEPFFLKAQGDGSFSFAEEGEGIAAKVVEGGSGALFIQVGEEGQGFSLGATSRALEESEAPYLASLRTGKFWGRDILIQQYGGEEYRDFGQKGKVEVGGEIFFVREGDSLFWHDDHWSFEREGGGALVQVLSLLPGSVKLGVWDDSGFRSSEVVLSLENISKPPYKVEEIFCAIRPRTPTQVSCQLGKRRVVLKEDDWWLKTQTGWRSLRSLKAVEDFLAHRLNGELFIVESIDTAGGKAIIKGKYFDLMRTQVYPLNLVANFEKKQSGGKKGKMQGSVAGKRRAPPENKEHEVGP